MEAVHSSGTRVLWLSAMLRILLGVLYSSNVSLKTAITVVLCDTTVKEFLVSHYSIYSTPHDGEINIIIIIKNFIYIVPFKTREPRCLIKYNTMQYKSKYSTS